MDEFEDDTANRNSDFGDFDSIDDGAATRSKAGTRYHVDLSREEISDSGSGDARGSSGDSHGRYSSSRGSPVGLVPEAQPGPRMCEEHSGHVIEKYCKSHDVLLCELCDSGYHRSCKVLHLSEAAEKSKKKKEHKIFHKDIKHVKAKLSRWKKSRRDEQKQLRKETDEAIASINDFRKDIDWALDRLEKKGRQLMEKRCKELNKLITDDLKLCEEMMLALDQLEKQVEATEDRCDAFVDMKKGNTKLLTAQKLTNEMKEGAIRREMVKFTVDPQIKSFALSLGWFGKDRTYLSSEPPLTFPHLYSVWRDNQFDVRFKGDKKVCSVEDMCQFSDGTVLLADSANQRVKQVDVTYKTIDHLDVPGEPMALCTVDETHAAVAYMEGSNTTIQIVENGSRLRFSKSFQIDGQAVGLAFNGGEFYVAESNRVCVYADTGSLLKLLYQDAQGSVRRMRIDTNGTKLYLIDTVKGVVILDKDGTLLATVSLDDNLLGTCALTLDKADQMFVCGHNSHNIVQFGHDQQQMGVVLAKSNGLKCPKSVWFDQRVSRMLVSMTGRNVISVYEMK